MTSDKIFLEGMVFFGHHGVSSEERRTGKKIVVDVEIKKNLKRAGESDQLRNTLDYSKIYEITKRVIEGRSVRLLERVAERIAFEILRNFNVEEVRVKVTKPLISIQGSILKSAGVEIVRKPKV